MDFETVVKRRRMCRAYSDRDVPSEKVDRILDLACRYPSAGHIEPQEFIVVRDEWVKGALARSALGQRVRTSRAASPRRPSRGR
jgi:nitroreductase